MGSQAAAVLAGLRWLLAITQRHRATLKLDRELLTRRDLERLFGVSKVRAAALMTAFGAGRTGHILTLPRAELLRQLRRHRRRAAFRGEEARRERRATSPPVPAPAVLVGWFDGGGRQPWRETRPSASKRSYAAASAGGEAQNGGSPARRPAYRAVHEGRGGRRAIGALVNAGHWERVRERALVAAAPASERGRTARGRPQRAGRPGSPAPPRHAVHRRRAGGCRRARDAATRLQRLTREAWEFWTRRAHRDPRPGPGRRRRPSPASSPPWRASAGDCISHDNCN